MKKEPFYVLFRCDGSSSVGMGHLMRCLALADELKSAHGLSSGFALRADESGAALLRRSRYPVFLPTAQILFDYEDWILDLVLKTQAAALVLDVRDEFPLSTLQNLRSLGVLLVTLDDPSPRRLLADLAFYPPCPQVRRMDWPGFQGEFRTGWQWVPLRREILEVETARQPRETFSLLLTAGGADPAGMSPKVVEWLHPLEIEHKITTTVVAGPAFQRWEELKLAAAAAPGGVKIERDGTRFPRLMAEADLAVASFGVTAFELAVLGIPSVYLCLTRDHEESASEFVRAGLGISLGLFSQLRADRLIETVSGLLADSERRQAMSQNGRRTLDGKGSTRIVNLVVEHLSRNLSTAEAKSLSQPADGKVIR